MRAAVPRVYRSFAEFEREELRKLDTFHSSIDDMLDTAFAEELDFDDVTVRLRLLANDEERRFDGARVEKLEDLARVNGVRAVVEREDDAARVFRPANDRVGEHPEAEEEHAREDDRAVRGEACHRDDRRRRFRNDAADREPDTRERGRPEHDPRRRHRVPSTS